MEWKGKLKIFYDDGRQVVPKVGKILKEKGNFLLLKSKEQKQIDNSGEVIEEEKEEWLHKDRIVRMEEME